MLFAIVFLFCSRLVNSLDSSALPSIDWASSDLSVNVNSSVVLECHIRNLNTNQVAWYKQEDVLIAVNDQVIIQKRDKYVPSLNANEGKSTLMIKNVGPGDGGFYKCKVNVEVGNALSKQIRLTVFTPPSILENTTSPVTASVNSSTKLECYVLGTPPPKAIWTREDGGPLPTGGTTYEGNVLRIDRVRKEHAGIYYCTAKNEVNDVKKTYKLQVEFEPEITVERKRVGQALGHKAELECKVAAFPDPEIIWYRDNMKITNYEPNYKPEKYAQPNAITISKLVITTVNRTQYGTYTCAAANFLKKDQQTIEFYETPEAQCFPPTCGSTFGYPDFKLIFSTTCMLILIFRW